MNQTRHMVMKACEEIMEAGGSARGIDKALLENLIAVCEVEIRERDFNEKLTKSMHDYSVWLEAELDRLPF